MMKLFALSFSATLLMSNPAFADDSQADFFDNLSKHCGERFVGKMIFPNEGQDSFAGKILVAELKTCNENEIRIPFSVGSDKSRTWIISKTEKGLQLKHDHRHEDGSPHQVNMYGGLATTQGNSHTQSFPADTHTAKTIPAASTNIWHLSLGEDDETFIYHLERHRAPRFTARLKRATQ